MDPLDLRAKLKSFALSSGFDDIGIASTDGPLPFTEEVEKAYHENRFGPLTYLEKSLSARTNILSVFPEAKTVIVVIKNYYVGNHVDYDVMAPKRAKIARYAWGKDYHQWFKKKLRNLIPFMGELYKQEFKAWPFNDTGPFLERSWAQKAGLGFIGKSAMFIHRAFGTWTLLGGLATDLLIPPDPPYVGPTCGSCTRCLEACPTSAIIKPHTVDANKCIATWTIERPLHPEALSKAPRDHSWGFGCDICQEVCPWNKWQVPTHEERFIPINGRIFLSRETFEQDLRGSPLHRATKTGLLANFLRIQGSLTQQNMKSLLKRPEHFEAKRTV